MTAESLPLFVSSDRAAPGVDDGTWLFHLPQEDYSRWFLEAIKDPSSRQTPRR